MESEMSERAEQMVARAKILGWKIQHARNDIAKRPHYLALFKPESVIPVYHKWVFEWDYHDEEGYEIAEGILSKREKEHAAEAKAKTLEEIRSKIAAAFESIGVKDRWELLEEPYYCQQTGKDYQYAVTIYSWHAPPRLTENDYASGIMLPEPRTVTSTVRLNEEDVDGLIEQIGKQEMTK